MKPNPKEINIILNILKGAQFEFLPRAPFYIDMPLMVAKYFINVSLYAHRRARVEPAEKFYFIFNLQIDTKR
jgi:hypothetical protein